MRFLEDHVSRKFIRVTILMSELKVPMVFSLASSWLTIIRSQLMDFFHFGWTIIMNAIHI